MKGPDYSHLGMFLGVSVIWGLTWIPIKLGVDRVSPLAFAGTRGLAAGAILLAIHRLTAPRSSGGVGADRPRLVVMALLANTLTYALLFWGVARVDSGLAAVVNLSVFQVSLVVFEAVLGEKTLTRLNVVSLAIGIVGLVLLYAHQWSDSVLATRRLGLVAVAGSGAAYALGSVLGRDLLRRKSPVFVAGWVQLAGGASLLLLGVGLRSVTPSDWRALASPMTLVSWLFLVVFGSVIAFTLYLRLTHAWSASQAGLYAFVSPIVALLAGAMLLGEKVQALEIVGAGLMLTATLLALRPSQVDPGRSCT